MGSPLPPDPYKALGVPNDADAAAIKSAYRKLVLKCHPDKISDESLKAQKAEEFHSIQQAYEILSDDDKRGRYDAQVRLAELRREVMLEGGRSPRADVRTAAFDVRTTGMPGATFSARTATRANYEDRRPSFDNYFEESSRTASRKYDGYQRRTPSRAPGSERERVRQSERESEKAMRSDRRRTRERDERRERQGKYSYVEDDDHEERPRYNDDCRRRDNSEEAERTRDEARRRGSLQDDDYYDEQRKMHSATAYMTRAGEQRFVGVDERPSVYRSGSSTGQSQYYQVRRSSAKPRDREDGRKGSTSNVDDYPRRPPMLQTTNSSPAAIKLSSSRAAPQRSHTIQADFDHREDYASQQPTMRRADTMPSQHSPSPISRLKDAQPVAQSKLRRSESATERHDSGYSSNSSPGTPEMPYGHHPQIPAASTLQPKSATSTKYQYLDDSAPYTYSNGRRTVTREPERQRDRSPEPVRERDARPPLSRTMPSAASVARGSYGGRSSSYAYAEPERTRDEAPRRPGLERHSASVRAMPTVRSARSPERRATRSPEGRGRDWEREDRGERERTREREPRERLYGEIDGAAEYAARAQRLSYPRNDSFKKEHVSYAPRYGKEHIVFTPGGRGSTMDERYSRPSMPRSTTAY